MHSGRALAETMNGGAEGSCRGAARAWIDCIWTPTAVGVPSRVSNATRDTCDRVATVRFGRSSTGDRNWRYESARRPRFVIATCMHSRAAHHLRGASARAHASSTRSLSKPRRCCGHKDLAKCAGPPAFSAHCSVCLWHSCC